MNFSDIFKPETEKERAQAEKDAQAKIDLTGDAARACLRLESFKAYKKQYISAEEKIVTAMLKCTQSYLAGQFEMVSYGSQMLVYMTRLKDLRSLLDAVTLDSKKGVEKDAE